VGVQNRGRMISVREASVDDVPALYEMLRESAAEQGGAQDLCVTRENLAEDGFGASPRFHVLIAEDNDEPVGVALYFFIYSTWTSRNGLYVEDLYVRPGYRKRGAARELMIRLAETARQHRCGRMVWLVLRSNPAVRFYAKLGAVALDGWMPMEMKATEIETLTQPGF
jgi:GNAT superfamily N-acetyltransferase